MEKKDKVYTTYFDINKACLDMAKKCADFTDSWLILYQKGMSNVLDALIENNTEKAKKAFLNSIDEIKKMQKEKMEKLGESFGESIVEAYTMAYAEGTRQAEHSVFVNLGKMVEDGTIPDPTGRLTHFLTELDKVSAELFAQHTKGHSAILMFPDDDVDKSKKA